VNFNSKILLIEPVTHNVIRLIISKPDKFNFLPGQAAEIEGHPFTMVSQPEDLVLEFIIKTYPQKLFPNHSGLTESFLSKKPGDNLSVSSPFGTINYQGKGVFIAGGAGITPFLSIFKMLYEKIDLKGNKLIFSNKTKKDIILETELRNFFDESDLSLTLTKEKINGYGFGRINEGKIKKFFNPGMNFYVCGPKQMITDIKNIIQKLGVKPESIIFEK